MGRGNTRPSAFGSRGNATRSDAVAVSAREARADAGAVGAAVAWRREPAVAEQLQGGFQP